jgi:glycosyltransferase involved in cell wall biosynthesis
MNVLHLIGTGEFAGTEQMVITICEGQAKCGHRVFVATRPKARVRQFLKDAGVTVIEATIGGLFAPLGIAKFCREAGVEILHAHLTSGTHIANAVSYLTGTPVIDHLHVYSPDLGHKVAAKRGALIAVSEHTKRYYVEENKISPHRIHTVPNGSNVLGDPDAQLSRETARRVLMEELRLQGDVRFIVQTARITAQKGQDLLVEAADIVVAKHPDAHFLLVGAADDTDFAEGVRQQVIDRNLSGRVHFLGFRRDIVKLLRAAHVAAIPSRFDPFPLAALEPFLVGTPIVAAKVGGIPELIANPEWGTLVKEDDAPALAEGIISHLDDEARSRRMGDAAQEWARGEYSVEAMIRKIDTVYASVARPRGAQSTSESRRGQ